MALSAFIPREKFLYTFQHVLPHYPLPTLESTCRKMLLTVEPLVTPDEFQEITKEMKEFLKNEGPMLQAILEKREKTEDNWVADLWDKYAYLVNRSSLLYTNFCTDSAIEKSDLAECAPKKQSARAGCVVFHHLKFYEMIADRKVSNARASQTFFSLSQSFSNFFALDPFSLVKFSMTLQKKLCKIFCDFILCDKIET
uniref:carnitine O-acetyltransferase, mitochondrial-like n=1 Tax=Ciona intestinalis TaxID=7719 RepID=UPI000EF54923|nr:carnitine O-acetyltransferase, mitochondrial-like [Ciona intestinalis]|eukprot:XP_026695421.1 carnitine O-acetyltransferase, mitochondrial-like [Ciona intestinalis]